MTLGVAGKCFKLPVTSQHVSIDYSVYHSEFLFASLTAFISAFISSKVISGPGRDIASFLISRNAFIAFSRMLSSLSAAIVKERTVIAVCAMILIF